MNPWTDLGDGVHVRQSRAFQMNSTLLLRPDHAVLVDPGVLGSELDDIATRVKSANPAQLTLVFTHAHWDHVLGRPWWPNARTLGHDKFIPELEAAAARVRTKADALATEHGETWAKPFEAFHPKERLSGLRFTKLGSWRVVFRDAFGHCDSQLSIHLPEQRVLIAADMLSDIEIPILNKPPALYLETLSTLLPVASAGAIETLIPGHGSVARGQDAVAERFRRDLTYLAELDQRVRVSRHSGATLEQTQKDLATLEDVERDAATPMREIHESNVRLAYEGVAASARSGS